MGYLWGLFPFYCFPVTAGKVGRESATVRGPRPSSYGLAGAAAAPLGLSSSLQNQVLPRGVGKAE